MRDQRVQETYASKAQQFLLATQVVKMILKIDGTQLKHKYANKLYRCYHHRRSGRLENFSDQKKKNSN